MKILSVWSVEVSCAGCGTVAQIEVLAVTRRNDGEGFSWRCPECGATGPAPKPPAYDAALAFHRQRTVAAATHVKGRKVARLDEENLRRCYALAPDIILGGRRV